MLAIRCPQGSASLSQGWKTTLAKKCLGGGGELQTNMGEGNTPWGGHTGVGHNGEEGGLQGKGTRTHQNTPGVGTHQGWRSTTQREEDNTTGG